MRRRFSHPLVVMTFAFLSLGLVSCTAGTTSLAGSWVAPTFQDSTHLTFDADGEFSGFDGCNRIEGGWVSVDETVELNVVSVTERECADLDVWLADATRARLDGEKLLVFDQASVEIGTLIRGGE